MWRRSVNCAAIPAHLAEAELFGHARGAFTGAAQSSDGLFGAAEHGTIFLDEIGDMPIELQAELLRALATGEVRRVGDTAPRTLDVRVVAATNVELDVAVERGRFRADLLARLTGHVLVLPPLRDRREDLLDHAATFLGCARSADRVLGPVELFSCDAAEALLLQAWLHNVRELEQTIRSVAATTPAGRVELAALPASLQTAVSKRRSPSEAAALPRVLDVRPDVAPTGEQLRVVLEHFAGNVTRTAAYFGKERRQVYRWAERHGVELARGDDDAE